MSRKIARRVAQRGGCAYFVGGFVRDMLLGNDSDSMDVDIEVHGIRPEELKEVLSDLGEVVSMGVSFGIFSLRHYNIDIAMPRREHATGRGHRDFTVYVDPFIGEKNAAKRRDFTVNALMQNVLTGEILDFFGGQDDLKNGILRHVDDTSFTEDPLRVFRMAQFAARFGFTPDPATMKLCSGMDVTALSKERIFGELEKALLKSRDPSVFFGILHDIGQLSYWFPEIDASYADERSVSLMRDILSKAACTDVDFKLGFMCAAVTASSAKSVRPGCAWLRRISSNGRLLKYCEKTSLACAKLACGRLPKRRSSRTLKLLEIFDSTDAPDDALSLSEIVSSSLRAAFPDRSETLTNASVSFDEKRDALTLYKERVGRPAVTGQDLLRSGIEPGPVIGKAVKYGEKLRLQGIDRDNALEIVVNAVKNGEIV